MVNGKSYTKAYKIAIASSNKSTREQAANFIKSKDSIETFVNKLDRATIGAKAATVAAKALAVAGNMLAMWAISAAIQAAVTAWDNYLHRVEKAAEKAVDAAQKNEELNKTPYKTY